MESHHINSLPKQFNDLPFELLGLIFTHYGNTETLLHPLETLLLVSRQWNIVARSHQALWGNLRIHLGHRPTQDTWRKLLPRRLECSGTTPLSIEIRYALDGPNHPYYKPTTTCAWPKISYKGVELCACIESAANCARGLLGILAGPNRELCKRWCNLSITLGGRYKLNDASIFATASSYIFCEPLTHPMPLLKSIHLEKLEVVSLDSPPLFPSTSSLRTVDIHNCILGSLDGSDFSSAQRITIRRTRVKKEAPNIFKFGSKSPLEVLDIDIPYSLNLSQIGGSLPCLHTLCLGPGDAERLEDDIKLPYLKTLRITISHSEDPEFHGSLGALISANDRPLSRITNLILSHSWLSGQIFRHMKENFKPMLEELECIERIEGPGEAIAIILKLLFEATNHRDASHWNTPPERKLELRLSNADRVGHLTFGERLKPEDFSTLARTFRAPDPTLSWKLFNLALHPYDPIDPGDSE